MRDDRHMHRRQTKQNYNNFIQTGQSVVEYTLLVVVLVVALIGFNAYMIRAKQGELRETADDIGVQYDPKTHKCRIYKKRAYSCATFPFSLTTEGKMVRSKFCKGFGKGELVDRKEMRGYIFKWRRRAGMDK